MSQFEKHDKYREALEIEMATYLPIVKLGSGKYMFGTSVRHIQLKGSNVLTRTSGGYMYIDDYLKHYSRAECIKLHSLIRKGDGTMKSTVVALL